MVLPPRTIVNNQLLCISVLEKPPLEGGRSGGCTYANHDLRGQVLAHAGIAQEEIVANDHPIITDSEASTTQGICEQRKPCHRSEVPYGGAKKRSLF
tara:strand:- start:95 stop:385 length:291 start_codon:yes stop_codon:yes gene_type:complete